MYDEKIMKSCSLQALQTSSVGIGGPFGAAIVKDGKPIIICSNSVLQNNDPTCHAEMNTIRFASKYLHTYDLSECELYATGFPCPMCLGAIMWAGIKKVYISGTTEDAEKIGFRDKFMYDYIDKMKEMCYNTNVLDLEFHDRNIAQELYSEYEKNQKTIY